MKGRKKEQWVLEKMKRINIVLIENHWFVGQRQ